MDRIDLSLLRLLQQRTRLSRRIGRLKRRHGAVVYVPERERELLRRIARLSRGKLPVRAARAIFREILSSSRAEQDQPPIGFLGTKAAAPPARAAFGACDRFEPRATWPALARGLRDGSLVLSLLTGADLAAILRTPAGRREFQAHFAITGDLCATATSSPGATSASVFIVVPRGSGPAGKGDRFLILIECKAAGDAVKRWRKSMSDSRFHVEEVTILGPGPAAAVLLRVKSARPQNPRRLAALLPSAGASAAILGAYQATEDDAE